MQKLILALVIMTSIFTTHAQYTVKGCVTDSTSTGEPYATVRIYNQGSKEKPIKMGVTDINGKFSQELTSAGKYTLQITSVGKIAINEDFELTQTAKTKDFGTLIIRNDANTLAGVEVVAQKPLVTTEIDRISYDIQADDESKTSNIFDMLKKVPMVTVDGEDNIQVNGSSNFKIYKNGRPNNGWSNNPKEVFKSIPASMIKRIEVITEPGAKYDAEGVAGILNIITDDNSVLNGIVGNVNAGYRSYGNYNAGTYLTTQFGKLTTSINYNYSNLGKSSSTKEADGDQTYLESGNRYIYHMENTAPKGGFHYGNIEASYEIDTLNLITLSFGGYLFDYRIGSRNTNTMYDRNGNILFSYNTISNSPKSQYFDFNGKLDYQHLTHNKGEAITFSYLLSTTNQENRSELQYEDLVNFPLDYDLLKSNSKLNFYEHTFQFDWTRPFAEKHKVEMGLKYILRQNFSETLQEYNNGQEAFTDFDHTTQIGAAYGEYSFNSKKWGARIGLRYEFAHLSGKNKNTDTPSFSSNISDFVPTLSGSYKINDANTLKVNFSTRINRPGISYLNPAKNESPTSVSQGNPNLESTRRNNLSLSYSFMKQKFNLSTSVNHTWSNNALTSLQYVKDNISYNTYANNAKIRGFGWSNYVQWTATKTTRIILNTYLSYNKYSTSQGIENDGWGVSSYGNVSQELPLKLKLSAYCNVNKSGIYSPYSKGDDFFTFYGFNLQRSFLKDNRLTVYAGAQNPFRKYRTGHNYTVQGDINGSYSYVHYSRSFSIGLSFRFGSLNASVKKVNKSISNDDLEGRK